MNTAVVQTINKEGDAYQLLFQNIVTLHGAVMVGMQVNETEIRNQDIRVGDTIDIGRDDYGRLYVDGIKLESRAPTAQPFFTPEPPPKDEYVAVLIGPVAAKQSKVDLRKTIPLTIRGVLNNAGLANTRVQISIGDEEGHLADVINTMDSVCTNGGS